MADGQRFNKQHLAEFKKLYESQESVDCTIGCEGGSVSAHKVVLSACSDYLDKVLDGHPVEHPIIILPELNINDLRTLIHYMYTGEVFEHSYPASASLLKTATMLCVNSLIDLNDDLKNDTSEDDGNEDDDEEDQPELQNQDTQEQYGNNNNSPTIDAIVNAATNNSMSIDDQLISVNNNNHSIDRIIDHEQIDHNNSNHDINDNLDDEQDDATPINLINNNRQNNNNINLFKSANYQFKCPVCQSDFQTICSFEYHMQRVHSITQFGCDICHKPFASLRYVLTEHMRRCHGWLAECKLLLV